MKKKRSNNNKPHRENMKHSLNDRMDDEVKNGEMRCERQANINENAVTAKNEEQAAAPGIW